MEYGQYYWDPINHVTLIFEEEFNGIYWFYCPDNSHILAYYEFELKNLRRY